MAGISNVVRINITRNTRTPTRPGFGTPLLMAYHTRFPERVRTYEDLSGLTADGFTNFSPVYRMAQALLSQSPRVVEFKVGRLPSAHTHTVELTMLTAVEGQVVSFRVFRPTDGVDVLISYTVPASATLTTVATAVELLVEAVAGIASTSSVAVVTATPVTAGDVLYFHTFQNVAYKDVTPDAGYDDELSALDIVDGDWYVPLLDTASEANIDLVAAWTEARIKLYVQGIHNTDEASGTGTVMSGLQALGYMRTGLVYTEHLHEYSGAAWAGAVLPFDAGSITWAFKPLVGVTPPKLGPTQEDNIDNVNGNRYALISGLNVITGGDENKGGGVSSGGEFLDIMHGTDWLTAELQATLFGWVATAGKIPFTDPYIDTAVNLMLSVLGRGVTRLLLSPVGLTASGPLASKVPQADRAARRLTGLKFAATYAGAIHKMTLEGTLSV